MNRVEREMGVKRTRLREGFVHEVDEMIDNKRRVVTWNLRLELVNAARVAGIGVVVVCARVAPIAFETSADDTVVAVRRDVIVTRRWLLAWSRVVHREAAAVRHAVRCLGLRLHPIIETVLGGRGEVAFVFFELRLWPEVSEMPFPNHDRRVVAFR